ncbi:profilin, required for normal timing of actin polymerization in response to thermal stress [Orbilia javanica]|uniref:Profilin n=1 Tax=Orbilia javanica TaxID=47235 RepID=A0AAN8N1M0_9PEZI
MSWQSYVDTSLLSSHKIDKAAIFSADGESVWATTPGFNITPETVKFFAANYDSLDSFFSKSTNIGEAKYVCIAQEPAGDGAYLRHGKMGVVIIKTKQALIIAHHPDTVERYDATKVTVALATYLTSVGY